MRMFNPGECALVRPERPSRQSRIITCETFRVRRVVAADEGFSCPSRSGSGLNRSVSVLVRGPNRFVAACALFVGPSHTFDTLSLLPYSFHFYYTLLHSHFVFAQIFLPSSARAWHASNNLLGLPRVKVV